MRFYEYDFFLLISPLSFHDFVIYSFHCTYLLSNAFLVCFVLAKKFKKEIDTMKPKMVPKNEHAE